MTKREELEANERGEGPLGHSADDEPVFVLVARDKTAATIVRLWAEVAKLTGAPDWKTSQALIQADHMDLWREEHGGGKVPGMRTGGDRHK